MKTLRIAKPMTWAAEDYFRIDLADVGHQIAPGKTHCMTWRRLGWQWVRDPRGGLRRQDFTRWVSARLIRRKHDRLSVLLTSRMEPDRPPRRLSITVLLSERENAVGLTRTWLRCPDCGRPVRVLYHLLRLQCRRCAGIKNRSAITFKTQRMMARERELHLLLGGNGDHRTPVPDERPRYMHRRRHAALLAKYVVTSVPLNVIRRRRLIRTSNAIWRKLGVLRRL